MADDDAWRIGARFRNGGAEHRREALDPACVVAFPSPAGIVADAGVAEDLPGAPRWAFVEMAEANRNEGQG